MAHHAHSLDAALAALAALGLAIALSVQEATVVDTWPPGQAAPAPSAASR